MTLHLKKNELLHLLHVVFAFSIELSQESKTQARDCVSWTDSGRALVAVWKFGFWSDDSRKLHFQGSATHPGNKHPRRPRCSGVIKAEDLLVALPTLRLPKRPPHKARCRLDIKLWSTSRPVHDFELNVLIAPRPSFQIPASLHSTRWDYEVVAGQGPQAQDVNPYLVASLRIRLLRRISLSNALSKHMHESFRKPRWVRVSPSGSAGSTCNELEERDKPWDIAQGSRVSFVSSLCNS